MNNLVFQRLRVPVRCVMNRYEDMESTGFRNPYLFRFKVGFKENGSILGIKMEIYSNAGNSLDICEMIMDVTRYSADGPFKIPNWNIDGYVCKTNLPSNTAFRGFGNPEASVVIHSIFELVAERLEKDAFEV